MRFEWNNFRMRIVCFHNHANKLVYVLNFISLCLFIFRNWSEVVKKAADIVMESLIEVEDEERINEAQSPPDVPRICSLNDQN